MTVINAVHAHSNSTGIVIMILVDNIYEEYWYDSWINVFKNHPIWFGYYKNVPLFIR